MANYLYNGVELPDINEVWTDHENYPYAFLTQKEGSEYIYLYTSKIKSYYTGGYIVCRTPLKIFVYTASKGVWSLSNTDDRSGVKAYIEGSNHVVYWTNHDITQSQTGGTERVVYPAAPAPVPADGPKIAPVSMLMGWLVGRRIAGQRCET